MPEQCLHTCRTQLLLWRWLLVDPILSKEFYGSIITLFIWETINSEARFISWECTVPLLSCAVLKISTVSSPFIAQKANLSPNMKNCSHCQFTSTSSPTTKFTDLTVCCHWQAVVIGRRLWLGDGCVSFNLCVLRDMWQRPLKSKSKPRMMRDQKPVLSRSTSTTKKNPVGPVIVYDLSCLLPIQKLLGENYVYVDNALLLLLFTASSLFLLNLCIVVCSRHLTRNPQQFNSYFLWSIIIFHLSIATVL